jgi:molybdopterin synthase sulfur carrier subunit
MGSTALVIISWHLGRVLDMAVTVRIPTTMRPISGGASTVEVPSGKLGEVLAALNAAHSGFAERLFDGAGELHKFVNIFVSDDDVRYLQGLDTPVKDGDTVSIIPAVAGGC